MAELLSILLQRSDGSIPWGFRIDGGNGYGYPLQVNRVTPGTIASHYLHSGDIIVNISDMDADDVDPDDVDDIIKAAGNCLKLIVLKRPSTGNSSPTPYPGSSSPSNASSSPFSGASPTRFTPTSPPPLNGSPGGFMSPRVISPLGPSPLTFAPKPPSPNPPSPTPQYSPLPSPAVQSPRNSIVSPSIDGVPNFPPPSPICSPPTEGGPTGFPAPPPPPPPPPLPNAGDAVPWRVKQPPLEDIDFNTPLINHHQNQNESHNHNSNHPSRRISTGQVQQYDNLPAALQSTLMKDKKPFTYTPGGIDLSEIRSPRMVKRLHYNQRDPPGNLARINIPPPPEPDTSPKVTSPPPPETYPHPRVQILPQPQAKILSVNSQPSRPKEDDGFVPYYKEQRPQSRSFRLLQVMTDTTAGEAGMEGGAGEETQRPTGKQEEDEMRFTGVRRNPIPSRAFQTLQRMTGDEAPQPFSPVQNHQPPASENNAGECELRYRGACIPSRSFKILQEMTGGSDDDVSSPCSTLPRPSKKTTTVNMQVMGNGPSSVQALDLNANPGSFVPPSQQKAEADPKKYTGGYIPSRSFRLLQAMTGGADDDDVNGIAPVNNVAPTNDSHPPEAEPRMYMGGNIPSRSFRLLQAMTEPDGPQGGTIRISMHFHPSC